MAAVSGGTREASTPAARRKASQSNGELVLAEGARDAGACGVARLPAAAGIGAARTPGADKAGVLCDGTAPDPPCGVGVGGAADGARCGGAGGGATGCNFDRSNDVRSQFSGITLSEAAAGGGGGTAGGVK